MNQLECPFNHELLATYATGNVEPDDRKVVEQHLASCTHCRHEILLLEQTWWALDIWREDAQRITPPIHALRHRVASARRQDPWWRRTLDLLRPYGTPAWLTPSMGLAVGLLILFVWPYLENDPSISPSPSIIASMASSAPTETPVSYAPVETASHPSLAPTEDQSREARFVAALVQSRETQSRDTLRRGGSGVVHTVGFTPNQHIVSSIDEDVELQPSYIYNRIPNPPTRRLP